MTALRWPIPANWNDELDDIERPFQEQSWETDTPVVAPFLRLDDHLSAEDSPEPLFHSWLVMWVCWPIVALCAVGLMVAVDG